MKKPITLNDFTHKYADICVKSDTIPSHYFDEYDVLFSGDFVFKGTIGNYKEDAEEEMVKSLKVFKYMPREVSVYPGHGQPTTVGDELDSNPFLKGI